MSASAAARMRVYGQDACGSITALVLELRRLGDDVEADALTRLMEDVSRRTRRAVVRHGPRVVGGARIGPARLEVIEGGKERGRR